MPKKSVTDIMRRLTVLEVALEKHLMESGEIRTDLAWIKKLLLAVAVPTAIGLFIQLFVLVVKR
jgi:hypothetical protein